MTIVDDQVQVDVEDQVQDELHAEERARVRRTSSSDVCFDLVVDVFDVDLDLACDSAGPDGIELTTDHE